MELTFVTDLGGTFTVEIDPNMELENVMALLEAEVRSPTDLRLSPSLPSPVRHLCPHTLMHAPIEVRDTRQRTEPLIRGARPQQPKSDDGPVWRRREVDAPAPEKGPRPRNEQVRLDSVCFSCVG